MRELIAASTEKEIWVDGVGALRVPAPTVRVGLVVLCVQHEEDGDDEQDEGVLWDREVLREVCADWMPLRTYSIVFANIFTEKRRVELLRGLVSASMPKRLQDRLLEHKNAAEGSGDEAAPRPTRTPREREEYWQGRVAEYRKAFGLTFDEVMDEPFVALLGQLEPLSTLNAKEKRRTTEAFVIAQSGADDAYDRLIERSRWPGEGPDDDEEEADVPEGMEWAKTEEGREKYLEEKLEKAQEVKEQIRGS